MHGMHGMHRDRWARRARLGGARGHDRVDERLARGRVAADVDAEGRGEHHAVHGEHLRRAHARCTRSRCWCTAHGMRWDLRIGRVCASVAGTSFASRSSTYSGSWPAAHAMQHPEWWCTEHWTHWMHWDVSTSCAMALLVTARLVIREPAGALAAVVGRPEGQRHDLGAAAPLAQARALPVALARRRLQPPPTHTCSGLNGARCTECPA